MARRRRSGGGDAGTPPWQITFTDLTTLLLTFFVLLLSMAVVDERAKLTVLGSVNKRFGMAEGVFSPLGEKGDRRFLREPGPMDLPESDLAAMRDMIFEDVSQDLDFRENKYVQILSISDSVLFFQGGTELSPEGIALLDRLLPYLQEVRHPLLVAGHTAAQREEEGSAYEVTFDPAKADSTWMLSFRRASAVYRHLIERGIPAGNLMLEGFGQFHPYYSNNTPAGRLRNRRVDLVLDKRNTEWIEKIEELQKEGQVPRQAPVYKIKGFDFTLTMPGGGGS